MSAALPSWAAQVTVFADATQMHTVIVPEGHTVLILTPDGISELDAIPPGRYQVHAEADEVRFPSVMLVMETARGADVLGWTEDALGSLLTYIVREHAAGETAPPVLH